MATVWLSQRLWVKFLRLVKPVWINRLTQHLSQGRRGLIVPALGTTPLGDPAVALWLHTSL